jgi:hypothetical protein
VAARASEVARTAKAETSDDVSAFLPGTVAFGLWLGPFKLAKITSGERVWIYRRVMEEGEIKALRTYIRPRK